MFLFILVRCVGRRDYTKHDVATSHCIPVHSGDRYTKSDILSADNNSGHVILIFFRCRGLKCLIEHKDYVSYMKIEIFVPYKKSQNLIFETYLQSSFFFLFKCAISKTLLL